MILERRNLNLILLTLVAMTSSLITGCAKEKPFDTQYRQVEQMTRSQFLIEENGQPVKYLYVPSTLGTPMDVANTSPFVQGDEKVVRLQWAEEGLEVLEIEREERFEENDLNESPVLTIPGSYKSYRCAEDAYLQCTNREEENTELEWHQKTSFLPDFEKLEVKEVNSLDIFAIDDKSCLSRSSTKVLNYEVSQGVLNIELEKSYRVTDSNFNCLWNSFIQGNFSLNSFKVKFFYSLIKLDQVASPNYKAVSYPVTDHNNFGFFEKEELLLNDQFDSQRKTRRILMNRWNPKRPNGEIVYHLSPEYSKDSNRSILKATRDAVRVMNNEMKASNVNLNIKLVEQPDPKTAINSGDLRYNSLVLIEDPLANGLLGYGPSVANPYTGEIVQAHTNMYLGVLKSMTRRVYDSAADLTEEEFGAANPVTELTSDIKIAPSALSNIPAPLAKLYIPELLNPPAPAEPAPAEPAPASDEETPVADTPPADEEPATDSTSRILSAINRHHNHEGMLHDHTAALSKISHAQLQEKLTTRLHAKRNQKMDALLEAINGKEQSELTEEEHLYQREARLNKLAKNNAFAIEFFPIGGTSKVVYPELRRVPGILSAKGTLKRWTNLNSTQRAIVQNIILISSYKATLIHELGHNLGLRHNFSGSFDKENFLSDEEAVSLGMESAPAYSSIMDYSFSEFNQLKAFGKYDLAALRFGYSSEVELETGGIVKIELPIDEKIAPMEPKHALEFLTDHIKEVKALPTTTAYVAQRLENVSAGIDSASIATMSSGAINYRLQSTVKALKETNNDIFPSTLTAFLDSKAMDGKKLKPYLFCTDENAGLSTSCNRFDEGTSLVEITNHMIKRYKDAYKYRNFRDGRTEYSAYGIFDYYFWRAREFGKIRDVLEEYEFFVELFSPELLAQGCSPEQVAEYPVCGMINDRRDSIKLVSDFFIEILKTPDHQCALANKDAPNTVIELRKLRALYDDVKYDLEDEVMLDSEGEIVRDEQGKPVITHMENRITSSCFDPAVVKKLEEDGLQVVGENGKFLNGFKDTDPNFRYVTDRATRGIWADKALAMKSIFQRRWNKSTSDRAHMALIDLPQVREQTEMLLAHFLQGMPMTNPLPFKAEKGQEFTIPYAIGNDNLVDPVEDNFWRIRRWIGMEASGTTSLISMAMNQIQLIGTSFGEEYRDIAFETRNLPAVLKFDGIVPDNKRHPNEAFFYDERARLTFVANKSTPIAMKMITSINSLTKLMATSTEDLDKVIQRKLNPEMPADFSPAQQLFWSIPENLQEILLGAAEAGNPLPEDAFTSTFGEVNGPILFAFFNEGPAPMKNVLTIKEELKNSIPADTPEALKEIYKLPIEIISEFKLDILNSEVSDYYQKQLRRMPIYFDLSVGPRRRL